MKGAKKIFYLMERDLAGQLLDLEGIEIIMRRDDGNIGLIGISPESQALVVKIAADIEYRLSIDGKLM